MGCCRVGWGSGGKGGGGGCGAGVVLVWWCVVVVCCGVVWCGVVWCGVVWRGVARRDVAWRGVAWRGVAWAEVWGVGGGMVVVRRETQQFVIQDESANSPSPVVEFLIRVFLVIAASLPSNTYSSACAVQSFASGGTRSMSSNGSWPSFRVCCVRVASPARR